jgi:hypothetical protein
MPRKTLLRSQGRSDILTERLADSEAELQHLIKSHPELIPAEDLDLVEPLLVIGTEVRVAVGSIDLACLDRGGEIVLIEFKTGPANPDFRHTLSQLTDYGAALWRTTVDGLMNDFDASIRATWPDLVEDEAIQIKARVEQRLSRGQFVYVAAAQRFTDAMLNHIEYLNETSTSMFYAVEVIRFDGVDLTAYAARVVARPPRNTVGTARSVAGRLDTEGFLDLVGDVQRESARSFIAALQPLGIRTEFVSQGFSMRVKTHVRAEPISIGWVYAASTPVGFLGSREITLGYDVQFNGDDRVSSILKAYVDEARTIPGAIALSEYRKLNAVYFKWESFDLRLSERVQNLLAKTSQRLQEVS